ncbi:MAG: DUF512 domain-containing protein [Deferribacteres bacterium]|nr:DUF512 domain-containing protein [candidate division KSB1 bacterium]MCB9509255.1 DUF512 domain-containing protein [Deferribacteres bacterium]
MKIQSIDKNSIAEELGLQAGDILRSINGHKVQDVIDYRFLISEEFVDLEVEREGEMTVFEIEKDADDTLGLNLEPIKVRMCGNDCPFCFVDQNPAGMRQSLYFRDEDFRLSFLAGHYVTLTNISQRDLERIVEQRLSPLFISVHAIDPEVRKFLLGLRHDDRLIKKLDYLTENDIELHTQIVVCPTHNDGKVMEETLRVLSGYFPHVRSVALVPLGLTKHREGLTQLQPVDAAYAQKLIADSDALAAQYKKKLGIYFAYPSDEFYLMAGIPLPQPDRYDTFDQLENGVGMVRALLNDFADAQPELPTSLSQPTKVTLVTGTLMGPVLQKEIVPVLNQIQNLQVELAIVKNDFYGDSIRTSGLLTGQDIFKNLADRKNGDCVFLPKNCVNDQQIFLDDWTVQEMQEKLAVPVRVIGNDFSEILTTLESFES